MNAKLKKILTEKLIEEYPDIQFQNIDKIKNLEGCFAHLLNDDEILFEWCIVQPVYVYACDIEEAYENIAGFNNQEPDEIEFTGEWRSK